MSDVPFSMLIEPGELAARLGAGEAGSSSSTALAIVDCRHDLARPHWGAQAYAAGHIPRAVFAHLERDLSGPVGPSSGRHPLPDPGRLAATFGGWGIDRSVQVVAYDERTGTMAARLWWLLRFLGHERAAVLDGGLAAWQAAGLPVWSGIESRAARSFEGAPHAPWLASGEDVARGLERGEIVLVDARSADRFAGRNETLDPVAGHVPGARNHPYTRNLGDDGRFLSPQELGSRWRGTLGGASPERVVSMCGSGVTACHNLLAMERAGLPGARLYAGSWSEWCRDPTRPVARP
ncbi:MAG: sulfurtransferase [Steroidobacteraceae bacterium]